MLTALNHLLPEASILLTASVDAINGDRHQPVEFVPQYLWTRRFLLRRHND